MDRPTSTLINKPTDYDKLQQILDKVRDLKQSLANFLIEYERAQPSWPTILDQMNVLSSQIATLRGSVRHLLPQLRSNSLIPMCLSLDNDPNVEQMTERRLSVFNHDSMPQLLRTKHLPEIEERERLLNSNSMNNSNNNNTTFNRSIPMPNEISARVQEFNSILMHIKAAFQETKDATEKTEKSFDFQRYTNPTETKRLIEAINYGTGLKPPDVSTSVTTPNEQPNINQQMPSQTQRGQTHNIKIKTVSKPNR